MREALYQITRHSLGSSPEEMLHFSLETCIAMAGASGGSILGEEGPYLSFLFSNVPELIGRRVPWSSIAGATIRENKAIYTFAPRDGRHFDGIDAQLKKATSYLLSIPIPGVVPSQSKTAAPRCAGVLQLLFETDVLGIGGQGVLPREFDQEELTRQEGFDERLADIILLLPIIQFGMEVMNLRRTSYQVVHELKNKLIGAEAWMNYLRDDIEAANGKEGLERLAAIRRQYYHDPLFIVLDLNMPVMNGWDVIKHLKDEYEAAGKARGIPIIVLSSTSGEKGVFFKQSVLDGKSGYLPLVTVAKETCTEKSRYDAAGEKGLSAWLTHFLK